MRALPSRADGQYDERLPPAHVTAGKHARHAGLIVDDIRRNVSARVETHPRLLDHPGLAWSEEAHGKQHQIGLELELATRNRSEEHTSELQSLMRISYAVFCLKKKKNHNKN